MHQIISGETRNKIHIKDRKSVKHFIDKAESEYKQLIDNKCIYLNSQVINSSSLNYLNIDSEDSASRQLKQLLRVEFDICEKIYPYLGDLFLELYFNKRKLKKIKKFKFHKNNVNNFLLSLDNSLVEQIANYIFNYCSLNYAIQIEKCEGNDVITEKYDNLSINIDYDHDFLLLQQSHKMKNYKFRIIDGMIETVGEIHHLLYNASINKEPYVIFCFGMSSEVKHVILENNKRNITNIFPVCITFCEETINILNDIAVLHNCEVISASKGQTISQEIRKKLQIGNEIIFSKNNIIINPVCEEITLQNHKMFLIKRADDSKNKTNRALIEKRIKHLNSRSIKIFLPNQVLKHNNFIRELDYILRFFKSINLDLTLIKKIIDKKFYYVPTSYVKLAMAKVKSINNIYKNINKLIIKG